MNSNTISQELALTIDKKTKKKNGIYFTPSSIVKSNIKKLKPYLNKIKNVLEPSCGSGEFIDALLQYNEDFKITGIENNCQIYNAIEEKFKNNKNVTLYHKDFMIWDSDEKYDMIIGNPPYFVMNKKSVLNKYYNYFDGRPNIFILFILKSLELLNDDGILSFVLPLNFVNCLYYDKTRKYIKNNFKIVSIQNSNDEFTETKQETITIIVQNTKPLNKNKFVMDLNDYTIFGNEDTIKKLKKLHKNSKSLYELGYDANVGNVIWNENKNILTTDESKTRLIYSANIENNKFIDKEFKNQDKKKYINKEGINEPLLVINRGYGVGEYNFKYCLLNEKFEFLVENHLICIKSKENISKEELLEKYEKLMSSFENDKTKEFIKIYFGNNAINVRELKNILPIYIE